MSDCWLSYWFGSFLFLFIDVICQLLLIHSHIMICFSHHHEQHLAFYHIKQTDSMLPWVCTVTDQVVSTPRVSFVLTTFWCHQGLEFSNSVLWYHNEKRLRFLCANHFKAVHKVSFLNITSKKFRVYYHCWC